MNFQDSLQIEDIQRVLNNKDREVKETKVDNIYDNINLLSMNLNESNYLFGDHIKFQNVAPDRMHIRENFIDNADKEKVVDWQFGDNEFNAIDRADMQGSYEQEFPA